MRHISGQERRLLVLAAALLVPLAILGVRAAITPETTDFRCLWTGASFVLTGRDPYDLVDWTRATYSVGLDAFGRTRESNCFGSYPYPLTTAIAMVPFGLLPLEIAAMIWELLIFAAAVVGAALLARAAGLPRSLGLALVVLVLASQPFEQTVMSAQFSGLTLLAVGLLAAPTLGSIRPGVGVLLAAMKPHIIPLVPLVRVRGQRAGVIAAAAVPILLVLLVSLVVRPTWPLGWLAELTGQRRAMFVDAVSLWTLASVAGIPALGPALVAAGIVPMAVAARRARDLHVLDAIAVVALAWLLLIPYGLTSGHLAPLAAAWAAILRRAVVPTTSGPLTVALLAVAGVMPWAMYLIRFDVLAYNGLEVTSALVPLATAVVLAGALARSPGVLAVPERSAQEAATSP
jgi:glycosyl transferase family 87